MGVSLKACLQKLSLVVAVICSFSMDLASAASRDSCELLLGADSFRFHDLYHEPQPKLVVRPRPSDLEIPAEDEERVQAEAKRTNLSPFYIAFRPVMKDLSEEAAQVASDNIKSRIQRAAQMVQQENYEGAMNSLNDPSLLEGTGYRLRQPRDIIYPDAIAGDDERMFSNQLIHRLRNAPRVNSWGLVYIPAPPMGASSVKKRRWAQREWIRTACEELGHVAQLLGEHANPDRRFLSQMLSNERSVVRSTTFREGEVLNARGGRTIPWLMEADIYAFLIETFGTEMIPVWFGMDSNYGLRKLVDDELRKNGIPGREWPESLFGE